MITLETKSSGTTSITRSNNVLSSIGSKGLTLSSVQGRRRVPNPPTNTITSILCARLITL